MVDFDYSIDAKNVINKFYGVDCMVYVEGDDDIAFWEHLFENIAELKVEVEPVGGKPELRKYAKSICSGEAEFLVAMDSDYEDITGYEYHPNILRTYGYSIENTLITKYAASKILKNICKLPSKKEPIDLCSEWMEEFSKKIKPLVVFDLANVIEAKGVAVIPRASERFMKSQTSCDLCSTKISSYLEGFPLIVDEIKVQEIEGLLDEAGVSFIDLLRGHFLFSAVMRFIKVQANKLGSGVSISTEMLYSNFMSIFESLFDEDHPHYEYYKESLSLVDVNA